MTHQLNLLSKETKTAASEKVVVISVIISVVLMISYGLHNKHRLSTLVHTNDVNSIAISEAQENLRQKRAQAGLPDIDAMRQEVEALKAKFAANSQFLGIIDKGAIGSPSGPGAFLALLASKHNPNIWLTAIEIDERGLSFSISGKSVSRDSVMSYTNNINKGMATLPNAPAFTAIEINQEESTVPQQSPTASRTTEIRFRLY